MTEREKDIEKIKAMKEGDTIYLRWCEEGGVKIHRYNFEFYLFEVPQYGGSGAHFEGMYTDINKMIDTYEKWT